MGTTKSNKESSFRGPEDAHTVRTHQADTDPVLAISLCSWSASVFILKPFTIYEKANDLGHTSVGKPFIFWLIKLRDAAFVSSV